MKICTAAALFTLCASHAFAQDGDGPTNEEAPIVEDAEEIIVIGQRQRFELRVTMLTAERDVYELFNKFNDEKRFEITCTMHQKTGTSLRTQVCVPAFKREALAAEAQDYVEAYRAFRLPEGDDYEAFSVAMPSAQLIRAGEVAYQRKMRQVAEEQPEFLRALIRYTEIKAEYEAATSMADEESN